MDLVIVVETPNGTIYQMVVPVVGSVKETLEKEKKKLGKSNWICDWWVE